ncbi:MAG TPA: sugar kinase [Candidatus Latescibacteria bacterium]|nr:sugar kinase [Candidatus Latescibacterota bacterium]
MYDVVSFGEAMLRLSPPDYLRLEQARSFDVNVGGCELNVAVGLSRFGLKTAWVTRLPRNPLGRMVANKAREHGVDTSNIVWTDGGRVGIYYLELGSTPRPSQVIYDRKGSAISLIKPGEVDWPKVFEDTRLFHTSGITPALSKSCAEVTAQAIEAAKEAGCKICFDLNYRGRLWSPEEAEKCLSRLMGKVDILITTQFDTETVFGMKGSYEEIASQLKERFGLSVVAITLREVRTVLTGGWTSLALADGRFYRGKMYDVEIIDRVGAGDAYTAGFIYGYLTGDVEKAVACGDAMAALEQTIPGDLSWFTEEEVQKQLKKADLRIQR